MNRLERTFGVAKPVIAMLHFPALPGRPLHDRAAGVERFVEVLGRDLDALQTAGVDGVLFCNEADLPYQLHRRPGDRLGDGSGDRPGSGSEIRVPFGVNILWDPIASLWRSPVPPARVFIREVLTGVYESDLGMIEPAIGEIAGYRSAIGGRRRRCCSTTSSRSSRARSAAAASRTGPAVRRSCGVDAILISGPAAGIPFAMSDLAAAKEAAPDTPVIANTGVRAERIARRSSPLRTAVIVGTSLKVDGITWNEVDPDRAARLMDAARAARASSRLTPDRDGAADPGLLRDRPPRFVEVLPEVSSTPRRCTRPTSSSWVPTSPARPSRRSWRQPGGRWRCRFIGTDYDVEERRGARRAREAHRGPRLLPATARSPARSRRWRRLAGSTRSSSRPDAPPARKLAGPRRRAAPTARGPALHDARQRRPRGAAGRPRGGDLGDPRRGAGRCPRRSPRDASWGYSNITPWHSHREQTEEQLATCLHDLVGQIAAPERAVLNIHVPPYGHGSRRCAGP